MGQEVAPEPYREEIIGGGIPDPFIVAIVVLFGVLRVMVAIYRSLRRTLSSRRS